MEITLVDISKIIETAINLSRNAFGYLDLNKQLRLFF